MTEPGVKLSVAVVLATGKIEEVWHEAKFKINISSLKMKTKNICLLVGVLYQKKI